MAFCTLLEWENGFDLDRYNEMNERAGVHDELPDGCLSRIVGQDATATRIIEIWGSSEDARTFSEEHAPLLAEFQMPAPSRVAAFETSAFQVR